MCKQLFLGIDIGSTTLKAVLLSAEGDLVSSRYQRTQSKPQAGVACSGVCQTCGRCNVGAVSKAVDEFLVQSGATRNDVVRTAVTGSQVVDELSRFLQFDTFVSEVSAHVVGARHYYPHCRAVLDVGGQDSKAMLFNPQMQIWVSKMSGICAAGTGAFLDGVAAKLNVPVEELAGHVNYDSTLQLSSVCAVLSATSVNKFKNRYPLGDVIAAACRAQARTVISGVGDLLVEYDGDIVFQGGVASNRAVAHYLQEITGNRVLIPEHNQIMGAFGAARVARDYAGGAGELARHEAIAYQARYENLSNARRDFVKLADAGCPSQEPLDTDGAVSVPLRDDFAADGGALRVLKNAPSQGSDPNAGSKSTDAAILFGSVKRSIAMRTRLTRREFFSKSDSPLVWRNLFFPAEILNALGVRMLTMETYAALRARSGKKLQELFDRAARKGFSAETCSFLRVLEGDDRLPAPDFIVGTSEPCQQGERILADLVRDLGRTDRYHLLHTPIHHDDNSVESIAAGLEASVAHLERSLGIRMDEGRLAEACMLSNEARAITLRCNELRSTSPPLMRGGDAILFANMFTQLWGRQELVGLQRTLLEELWEAKKTADRQRSIDDTHRLVWLHLPPFYSSRLLDFIEVTCNAPIVFEEVNSVGWPELDPDNPYRSLARKLLAVGFLDPELRVQRIRDYAEYAKISGYLLYNHMFGRCSMADSCFIKHVRDELQAINVPLLVLDGDCLDETIDPCSTFTKVRAFIESLNMKKYGSLFGDQSEGGRESAPTHLRQPA